MFAYCKTYGDCGVPSPPVKVMAEVPDFRYITARTPIVNDTEDLSRVPP